MTDQFNGDNANLIASINALLALDASGSLEPHGIGGHARFLLETSASRLQALSHAAGQEADEMVRSLPERVWLQVDVDADDDDIREPVTRDNWECLSWHYERIGGHEVEYVRADLTPAATTNPAEIGRKSVGGEGGAIYQVSIDGMCEWMDVSRAEYEHHVSRGTVPTRIVYLTTAQPPASSEVGRDALPSDDYQRGFHDGYERRHLEVLGALV